MLGFGGERVALAGLPAAVAEVGFKAEFGRELGESIARIHFDPPVLPALLVRRLESAVVCGAVEGNELVEAVAEALEGAVSAIDDSVGGTCLSAGMRAAEKDLFGDLDCSVEDVAEGTTEFARGIVLRSGRGLDVGVGGAAQCKGEGDQDQFSHYGGEFERGMRADASGYCRFVRPFVPHSSAGRNGRKVSSGVCIKRLTRKG